MYIIFCSNGDNEFKDHFPLKAIINKELAETTLAKLIKDSQGKNFLLDSLEFNTKIGDEITILSRTSGNSTYAVSAFTSSKAARTELNTNLKDTSGMRANKLTVF